MGFYDFMLMGDSEFRSLYFLSDDLSSIMQEFCKLCSLLVFKIESMIFSWVLLVDPFTLQSDWLRLRKLGFFDIAIGEFYFVFRKASSPNFLIIFLSTVVSYSGLVFIKGGYLSYPSRSIEFFLSWKLKGLLLFLTVDYWLLKNLLLS